jgi:hypothetical protein
MRACRLALLCAVLGVVGGCSVVGREPTIGLSQPPSEIALEKGLRHVAETVKWSGVEASPVRQAHALAPSDWIVCAQSSARDLSPPYAMFFEGDKMVHFRIAVVLDDCARVPYAPVISLTEPGPAPLVIGR